MKKRLISLFVALTMLLCLIPAAFAVTFNAGTYTASANGMNGAVTVEVTFSDSAITDVKVTEQAETPAIASGALEQIPADIVAHQTLAVDTVTGATITSKAILAAVEDCVKQAGADPDTLRTPVEKNTADVGDRTAHVEVLVIGGGGTGLAAAMSAMDSGAKDVMVVEKLSRFGGSTSVSGAVVAAENTYYTQSIGLEPNSEVWLEEWKASSDSDIGVLGKDPGYPTYERVSNYFTQVGETINWLEDEGVAHWVTYPFFPNGRYQVPDYVIDSETGAADPEGGYMLIDHMVDWLKNHDADLRLSTTGTKLLTNDAGAGDTGDGMQMALDVGGVFYNDPYVITLGSTSRNGSIAGFCMSVNLWGRMVVNSKAQRFFNEGYMPYQATVALSRTEDGIAWALGDSKFAGAALLDAAVDGTEVVKADTIEELAALMGVDADTLVKSVETYNTACATGNDTEFGKDASNLTAIDAAPYYAVRIYVCTGGTIAGVKTNLDFQVLREDGSVINGLYAGGETSNREMYAYAYSSGSGVGYALASGRQIGMNLMK